jgi:hypothetical protein
VISRRLTIFGVAVAIVSGCSGTPASQRSSTPVARSASRAAPSTAPDRPTTVPLETAIAQRGVTVALRRMVLHTDGPPEVVIDFANHRRTAQDLELASDRVVATQGGTRIVARGAGGGSTAVTLTGGASLSGWSLTLPGLRPGEPYTLTATVTVPVDEIHPPPLKPVRFRFDAG